MLSGVANRLEELAAWAVGLRSHDIPERVRTGALIQMRSVLASVYAGADSEVGRQCGTAARGLGSDGRATMLADGAKGSAIAAVLANAACSMAHDYDDYLFLGHTGHSAVLATLAVAEEVDASLDDVVCAQVAANEIAGRLGAYVAIGPQNGQLWAHIHLGAAAIAAARLRGLDAERAADALAIALYQPPFTLFVGFMTSEAKALTAAQPAAMGLYAAALAAAGMEGPRSILEHPRGFGAHFSFVPVPELLGGLGDAWVSDSLSCKIYPGCAYIDGPVDAALAAWRDSGASVHDIESIEIEGTALTSGMEAIAEESGPASSLAPIAVTFSARRSVAIALVAGGLTPRYLAEPWLAEHGDVVRDLAARSRVRMSATRTADMLAGIGKAVPLGDTMRAIGLGRLWRARAPIRAAFTRSASRGGGRRSWRGRAPGRWVTALGPIVREALAPATPLDMSAVDFQALEFRFGARVGIELRGGRTLEATVSIPQGAAGTTTSELERLMIDKLAAETDRARAIEDVLGGSLDRPVRDLIAACVGQPT